jgi:Predicted Zn-dependent protease (DUF2268)
MKIIVSIMLLFALSNLKAQGTAQKIITSDIDNFWTAFDKISQTLDTIEQANYLKTLFFEKGTIGLKNIMEKRRYTPKEYLDNIHKYPLFWKSIRESTLKAPSLTKDIEADIEKLKLFYPNLKPSTIYFTMGCFRTNGTIEKNTLLIGSEMALYDKNVNFAELPQVTQNYYKTYHLMDDIALHCSHEYVHTQQKDLIDDLLVYCLYEGVAEFVSCKVTGKPSFNACITFGKNNTDKVRKKFEQDMFSLDNSDNWLWGTNENELKERDLGYYIGYTLCERYFDLAKDKKQAIKEMIELDYSNEKEVQKFVDKTKFFSKTVKKLHDDFEKSIPKIVSISQFKNGSQNIDPNLKRITLNFSKPMNKNKRGFDFGPLGENNVLRVKSVIGFSEDGKSFTFEVELKPNQRYQSVATSNFLSIEGKQLKPFLIDFKTADK